MKTFVIGALALIWVGALLGLSGWVWLRSRRLDDKRARDRKRIERDRHRPEGELERAVREAVAVGAVVAVDRRGHNPTRLRWSDGAVWFFYDDEEHHISAQDRGLVPPGTICVVGEPPVPGAPRPPAP